MDKMYKKGMDSAKGIYSSKSNPMKQPKQVAPQCGPGGNSDQAKANRLLQQAQKKEDSLRGQAGM